MSQIASKVSYCPPNTLLSRRTAMPWSTHWALLCLVAKPTGDAIANAPSHTPGRRHTSKSRAMLTAPSL